MKSKLLRTLLCLTFTLGIHMTAKALPTVGFFPKNFPRDPVDVNTAAEHTLLAQIIDTLVNHDQEGNLVSGVAKSWTISRDGKEIVFTVDPHKTFPTGKSVVANDVKYSIDRHRFSKGSQSKEYLTNIASIEAVDDHHVKMVLKKPQPSILKVLSRSHLGIVPAQWTFDAASDVPYLGTGDYQLVRNKDKEWILSHRNNEKAAAKNLVTQWKLVFSNDAVKALSTLEIPDYLPIVPELLENALRKDPRFATKKLVEYPRMNLAQTAAWWHPMGKHYLDNETKRVVMAAIRELGELRRTSLGLERTTGLIPKGVPGSLNDTVKIPLVDLKNQPHRKITVVSASREVTQLFDCKERTEIEKKYNITFVPQVILVGDYSKMSTLAPDVFIISWLGGFADPEGFLPVLTTALSVDLKSYLGPLAELYEGASTEGSWEKRAELFRKFNFAMIEQEKLIPLWKPKLATFLSEEFEEAKSIFLYMPEFSQVRKRGWSSFSKNPQ